VDAGALLPASAEALEGVQAGEATLDALAQLAQAVAVGDAATGDA
jgi:hypothetical protein